MEVANYRESSIMEINMDIAKHGITNYGASYLWIQLVKEIAGYGYSSLQIELIIELAIFRDSLLERQLIMKLFLYEDL